VGRPGARHTRDFEDLTEFCAQQMAKSQVQALLRVAWDTVGRIVERVVSDHLDERRLAGLVQIGCDRQRTALARVQQTNARLYRAYLLKEQLRALYHLDGPADAPAHLDAWLAWASRSKLRPFIRLARTLRRYRDGILAAITLGITNARLEGLHSKVRLLSHRSFGFHSAAPLIALIYLCCHHHPAAPMNPLKHEKRLFWER
jgi:Transposase/Helix-turn-helix domain of transposase family ISL3